MAGLPLPGVRRRIAGSLRLRLVAGAALWVIVALTTAGVGLQQIFADYVESQMQARLQASLDQLTAALEVPEAGPPVLLVPLSDPLFRQPLSGLYWQVQDGDLVLLRSRSLWDGIIRTPHDADGAVHAHLAAGPRGQKLLAVQRTVYYPDREQPLHLVVARDAAILRALVGDFTRTVAFSLGFLAIGLVAAAWAQVAFGLTPLSKLRRALAAIREGRREHMGGVWPTEVQPLVDDLDALLVHNARMVEAARVQAGNLAHALKTPLAIIGNEAEIIAAAGHADSAALLTQQVEAMRRQVDVQLARARAQAAGEAHRARTPVLASLERLSRVLGRLHPCTLTVAEDSATAPDFKGDRQTLEEILGNLMDNACKWAAGHVLVRAFADAGGALVVTVEDDGPGIPEDRMDEALRRGLRLDESKPGSGLGLSIVDDLTRAAGGSVALDRSPGLGGLRATVTLPAA